MNAKRDVANTWLIALAAWGGSAWGAEPDGWQRTTESEEKREVTILPTIVVTATASARSEKDVPASVSTIEGESLRQRPVNNLGDALRGEVSVGLDGVGLGRQQISIRGMNPEHTLILIDGQRVNSSASAVAHSDFELGWAPTEAIERVEVVRGPMSSLYGSDALGGVVNVITRTATDFWQGSASGYALINDHGLDGNQYKGGFYLGGPLVPGRLGVNLWGEYRRRDALRDANDTRLTALDEERAATGQAGLVWTPDAQQRIDLAISAGNEDQNGSRTSAASPFYETAGEVQRRRYSLSHVGDWDWGNTQLRLYRSTLDRVAYRSDGIDTTSPTRFVDTVLDGKLGFRVGKSHKLTFGAEGREESLEDPNVNRAGKKTATHYALLAQDEILLGERWELVLGSRFDHHEDFGWETNPRAYLLFHASNALVFKLGAGRGFKAPTLKQLSPEFESRAAMGGRGIIRGNPDLQPETNESFELGVMYARGAWSAAATAFYNDVSNLVETVQLPTCSERGRICLEYENVASARLQGLELSLGVDLSEQWQIEANYTYLDAHDRTNGERLPDRSRHRANAQLVFSPTDRLSTRLWAEYTGAQHRSAMPGERPDYALVHWYVDYELATHLSLHAGIENLTDERLANDDAGIYERADEGLRYFAGLTASF